MTTAATTCNKPRPARTSANESKQIESSYLQEPSQEQTDHRQRQAIDGRQQAAQKLRLECGAARRVEAIKRADQKALESESRALSGQLCDKSSLLQQRPSASVGASRQLIDSRSILVNKPRLKRFWERRIEMDVRLRLKLQQQQQQQQLRNEHEFECNSEPKMPQSDANNNFEARNGEELIKPEVGATAPNGRQSASEIGKEGAQVCTEHDSDQVPKQRADEQLIQFQSEEADEGGEGCQLISIDPTICHAAEHELEEQCADEEFSSTNSSFGPVSISVARGHFEEELEESGDEQDRGSDRETGRRRRDTDLAACAESASGEQASRQQTSNSLNSDEDEQNLSTCSGSVLTVISNSNNRTSHEDSTSGHHQAHDQAGQPAANDHNGRPIGAHQSMGDLCADANADECEPEADSSSNIGVAFESLQFEDEIKSSRNERVDEELLMSAAGRRQQQHEVARGPTTRAHNKSNLERVKSACNFITGAISDAARQVHNQSGLNGVAAAAANNDKTARPEEDENHSRRPQESSNRPSASAQAADESRHGIDDGLHNDASPAEAQQELAGEFDDEPQDELEDERQLDERAVAGQLKTDLASIFDANVKREIERFEANSMLRCRSLAGAAKSQGGLTEWKIAQEIRHFNEREQELKRRMLAAAGAVARNQQVAQVGEDQLEPRRPLQQLESVVRCGKLLQIPKYSAAVGGATLGRQPTVDAGAEVANTRQDDRAMRPALKLTASVNGATDQKPSQSRSAAGRQQATTISMHRFVSSGGKRLVERADANSASPSSSSSSYELADANLAAHCDRETTTSRPQKCHKRQLAKSMSNLSNLATSAPPPVDYRAVDSLKCREVPNVEAGLARRTIESFSRLNGHLGALSSSNVYRAEAIGQRSQHFHAQVVEQRAAAPSSAEQKIQAELRDIREREAELEHQRRWQQRRKLHERRQLHQLDAASSSIQAEEHESTRDGALAVSQEPVLAEQEEAMNLSSCSELIPADDQNSSCDSLYPIKETIESFRKLATSSADNPAECVNSNGKIYSINRVICRR